eukprot:2987726-Amphidinium_carterae.1
MDDSVVLPPVNIVTRSSMLMWMMSLRLKPPAKNQGCCMDDSTVLPPVNKVIDVDVDDVIEVEPVSEVSGVDEHCASTSEQVNKVIDVDVDDVIEVEPVSE